MKGYLRYRRHGHFGVIASPESNVVFTHDAGRVLAAANELLVLWNPQSASQEKQFSVADFLERTTGASLFAEKIGHVTKIAVSPTNAELVAVGYFDGSVRLWDLTTNEVLVTLQGHKSGISIMKFSWDTDIVIWDTVAQAGLFRLCGHRNEVTALDFVYPFVPTVEAPTAESAAESFSKTPRKKGKKRRRSIDPSENVSVNATSGEPSVNADEVKLQRVPCLLVSGSKDGTVRVWDLATQWCVQTVFDVSGEVWSLAVDPCQQRIVVGSSDHRLRVFKISLGKNVEAFAPALTSSSEADIDNVLRISRLARGEGFAEALVQEKREQERFAAPVLEALGTVDRPTGKGRIAQLGFAVDASSLKKALADRNMISYDDEKVSQLSLDGRIVISPRVQVASLNSDAVLLAMCPNSKSIEFYHMATPDQQQKRFMKRQRRALQKLAKREEKARSVQQCLLELEGKLEKLGAGRTAIGASFETERNTAAAHLLTLQKDVAALKIAAAEGSPGLKDVFLFIQQVAFKKKVVSFDYSQKRRRLILSLGDGTLELLELSLAALCQVRGAANKKSTTADLESEDDAEPEADMKLKVLQKIAGMGHNGPVRGIAMSHDDSLVSTFLEKQAYIWSVDTLRPVSRIDCDEVLTSGFFVAGNAQLVLGTSKGNVLLANLSTLNILQRLENVHVGPITAIAEHPKRTGFVTVSTAKTLKYCQFYLACSEDEDADGPSSLRVRVVGDVDLVEEALCVAFSPNAKFIAVAFLDSSIQLLHADSFKTHLTLYGHSLLLTSIAISSDSTLLLSGSNDKTIKIWGMDYGNIHKSWHAHEEGVAQVCWLRLTHFAVSCGRDGQVKLWDVDRRAMIAQLPSAHTRAATCLVTTRLDADRIFVGGADRSVRVWARSDEQMFPSEEQEMRIEAELAREIARKEQTPASVGEVAFSRPTKRTVEAITNTEHLMEVIDKVDKAWEEIVAFREALQLWKEQVQGGNAANDTLPDLMKIASLMPKPTPPAAEPSFLGMSPFEYFFNALIIQPSSVLDEVIVGLPFRYAEKLLIFGTSFAEAAALSSKEQDSHTAHVGSNGLVGLQAVETVARVVLLVVHLHMRQLSTSENHRQLLMRLRDFIRPVIQREKDRLEFNLVALRTLQKHVAKNTLELSI